MPYNGPIAVPNDLNGLIKSHEDRLQTSEESIQTLVKNTAVQAEKIDALVTSLDRFVNSVDTKFVDKNDLGNALMLRIHDLEGESRRRASSLKTLVWVGSSIAAAVSADLIMHLMEALHVH